MTFHTPPENFTYEFEENFKRNITRIWIVNHQKFLYNDGEPVKSVWGFQHQKTKVYYSPINSKTVGKEIKFQETRAYSAMRLNQNPLMAAFM